MNVPASTKVYSQKWYTAKQNKLFKAKYACRILLLVRELRNTNLLESYKDENHPWSENLFVTRDYYRLLQPVSLPCDEFLRSVWWIGCVPVSKETNVYILLNSFECQPCQLCNNCIFLTAHEISRKLKKMRKNFVLTGYVILIAQYIELKKNSKWPPLNRKLAVSRKLWNIE